MKKRNYFACVLLMITLVSGIVFAQSEDDFDVKQNADNTLTITGYKGTERNVVIPDKLYGLKVTIIGNSAFRGKELISVVIPDTVITIENGESYYQGAFSDNEELIKVTLGKGIKTIGGGAFCKCQLTEIIIPDSVTEIGNNSFCLAGLVKVTLGKGLQTIGEKAFSSNQITEISFPSTLKVIGRYAFNENKIQKVTFGTSLEAILRGAFHGNQITELNNLPSSLKRIEPGAFANNKIQSVTIPNGITTLTSYHTVNMWSGYLGAFENNPLTTVVIPASLVNIDVQSFGKIAGNTITRITIPSGMKENALKDNFEEAFVNFWISQNRSGGTYVKRGPIWTKE